MTEANLEKNRWWWGWQGRRVWPFDSSGEQFETLSPLSAGTCGASAP